MYVCKAPPGAWLQGVYHGIFPWFVPPAPAAPAPAAPAAHAAPAAPATQTHEAMNSNDMKRGATDGARTYNSLYDRK